MIIAVNTKHLSVNDPEGRGEFIFECFSRLALQYSQHQFIFIFDKAYDKKFITSSNIIPVITGPQAVSPLHWQYWYNYKVPALLKKYKADVFISMDGICSLRTKVPQCLFLHDLGFVYHPVFFAKSHLRFYKKFTPKFLAKAKTIAVISESLEKDIINRYKIDPVKVELVYRSMGDIFKPVNEKEKEAIKEKFAEGKEYFLYSGSIAPARNLLNLLKAFSFFKKWQKSNMQLLIAGQAVGGYKQFAEDLRTFKFRNDVKLLGGLSKNELANITAAAYAMVSPVLLEDHRSPMLEAMQCGVPVISCNTHSLPGSCAAAVLQSDPQDIKDIAHKMMLLFKDESKRNELVGAGKLAIQGFTADKTAALLWKVISKTIQ